MENNHTKYKLEIDKLSPKSGDIITVKFPRDMCYQEMQAILGYLSEISEEIGCPIVGVIHGITLDITPEKEMNKFGWYKKTKNNLLN